MRKITRSTIAVFALFLLFTGITKVAFSDTLSIIREGIGRDLQGITRKQAEIITAWMDTRKKDIRVTANNLPAYRASVIREKLEPDFSKPLEYLTFLKNIYHYKEVFVVNPSGTIIVSTDKNNIGKDVSSAQYFQESIKGKTFLDRKNIYHYKEGVVVNPSGTIIVSTDKNNIGKDVSSAQYFQESIKGKTFFSDIMPSTVPIENE